MLYDDSFKKKSKSPIIFSNLCGMESLHIGKRTKPEDLFSDISNINMYELKLKWERRVKKFKFQA